MKNYIVDNVLNKTIIFAYSYDNAGNRLSKIYENGDTEIYSYDKLYQLTKVETKDKTTEYDYDKVGNRMQMKIFATEDTEAAEYFYNSDNQLLSYNVNGTDTVSFIYDANGNQIFKITASDTVKYDYDYDNNLLCVSAANDTNIISYIYSPDGKRLKKYLNGIGTNYFYDADDVLTEYDTNTVVVCRYTNNLGIDDIISSKRNSISEYYHKDALGSIVNLTDNSQLSTVNYRYDEFGSIESQSNSHQNEYTYTGRQIDREAGLYYYRSRYYNSESGRFTQKDKYYQELLNNIDLNENSIRNILPLYLYAKNNPIVYRDTKGKEVCTITAVVLLTATAGALIYEITKNCKCPDRTYTTIEINPKPNFPPPQPDPCVTFCVRCIYGKWWEKAVMCIACVGCLMSNI